MGHRHRTYNLLYSTKKITNTYTHAESQHAHTCTHAHTQIANTCTNVLVHTNIPSHPKDD